MRTLPGHVRQPGGGNLSRTAAFGVIGGYGATGRVVVSELRNATAAEILVAGRDLAKSKALAAEFGSRVSAQQVDVLDAPSLDDFCGRCSIVVNCAGPVMALQDRVAQAAVRQGCHYIDGAGMSVVTERLLPRSVELEKLGLSFVISAGWMPGISELIPAYCGMLARSRMQTIESLTVYFGDGGDWSDNALRDGVWHLHQRGLRTPGYFHRGQWTRAKTSAAFRTVDLGGTVGTGRFCMFSTPELNEIGEQFSECDVFIYSHLSGFRSVVAATLIAMLPLPDAISVPLLRGVFRRNRLRVGGLVVAQVLGESEGTTQTLSVQATFAPGRDYWIHGLALATAARMVSEGKRVHAGVHYLANAVDPTVFVNELRKGGAQISEACNAMRVDSRWC
jgi:saccharopine dehydrogenase (NAD+, L-lysine forming)